MQGIRVNDDYDRGEVKAAIDRSTARLRTDGYLSAPEP
jgi:hypothetical protein